MCHIVSIAYIISVANSNLKLDVDYVSHTKAGKLPQGGRPSEQIMLTTNAFKHFCMTAPTAAGKLVRQYFVDAENQLNNIKGAIQSGRIEVKDTKTGEVYNPNNNPINDPEYCQTRVEAAGAHVSMNNIIRVVAPSIPASDYAKVNAKISEAVLGKTPRKFLIEHNFIRKKKKRNGRMAYSKKPNARDVMEKPQLHGVASLQHVVAMVYSRHKDDTEGARKEVAERLEKAKEVFSDMHGTHINTPTNLEEVKEAHREFKAVEQGEEYKQIEGH